MTRFSILAVALVTLFAVAARAEGCCVVKALQPGAFICVTVAGSACVASPRYLVFMPDRICRNPGVSLPNCSAPTSRFELESSQREQAGAAPAILGVGG